MERLMYADMAKELLGDDLYLEMLTSIAKENKSEDLESYGKEVIEKCCLIMIKFGVSQKVKMDSVKFCLENRIVEINCKEFAKKYEEYTRKIEENSLSIL